MNIEIKKSQKLVKYEEALRLMEERLLQIDQKKTKDLIWVLEHENIYTAGTSYKENEILDKAIDIFKTNRGGKITYHGPGQLICYFVIDLKKIKKDIRNFISIIEKTIIDSLKSYNINTFSDKENIGIWYDDNSEIKKVAAIGVRVSKWIAYHGFSINIDNDLRKYDAIIPCGIKDKGITNLKTINVFKTNRGGKITYHGPGQLICYFVIDLKKIKKDIRNFISIIEKTIIDSLKSYDINTFSDKENIGIWYDDNSEIKKVAAIGVRVSKWIAYHGFSINIDN